MLIIKQNTVNRKFTKYKFKLEACALKWSNKCTTSDNSAEVAPSFIHDNHCGTKKPQFCTAANVFVCNVFFHGFRFFGYKVVFLQKKAKNNFFLLAIVEML